MGDPSDFPGTEKESTPTSDDTDEVPTNTGENTVETPDAEKKTATTDSESTTPETTNDTVKSNDTTGEEESGRFDSVKNILSGSASTARGAASKPFGYLSSSDPDTAAEANGGYVEEEGSEYDEPSTGRRGFIFALGFGTGAVATGGAGVLASDAAEGELGDGEYGVPQAPDLGLDDNGSSGATGNNSGTPARESEENPASAPTDEQDQAPGQTQTTTADQTPELAYEGEIDGRGYEVVDIPGRNDVGVIPEDAAGFKVDEDLLSSYDPDAWYNISSDESGPDSFGFDDLGASTEWYVTEDSVIGVDTRDREVVRFTHEEFGYDTQALYEDIQEDIR